VSKVRTDVFEPLGDDVHWEGIEVGAYWNKLGKLTATDRIYEGCVGLQNNRYVHLPRPLPAAAPSSPVATAAVATAAKGRWRGRLGLVGLGVVLGAGLVLAADQ
jgi:hypothetical protein